MVKKSYEFLIRFAGLLYNFIILYQQYPYIVEVIDIKTHEVIIRCRGRSTIIKTTFEDIISDRGIIDKLPPFQSCLLGGYYGKALRASQQGQDILKKNSISFLLRSENDHYKITCLNRDRSIKYINQKTKQEYIDYPINIARDEILIGKFNASQACYIGILAGIGLEQQNVLQNKISKPYLRLVK